MSGKETQSKQADDVIGGKKAVEGLNVDAKPGALFGAVSALAAVLAPDLELAPKDESESEIDLSIRLLGELEAKGKIVVVRASDLEGSLSAHKGLVTKAENAMHELLGNTAAELVARKLATQSEIETEGYDPLGALFSEFDIVSAERNALKRSLSAQKGATTRKAAELETLEASIEPRKLGPIDDQLGAAELFDLLKDEPRVEIAFSDGRNELAGVSPAVVSGECFTFRRGRLGIDVPNLTVNGPVDERGGRVLAGYALLIGDEQIAWLPRIGGQLTLGAGQTYQLKDDIVLI